MTGQQLARLSRELFDYSPVLQPLLSGRFGPSWWSKASRLEEVLGRWQGLQPARVFRDPCAEAARQFTASAVPLSAGGVVSPQWPEPDAAQLEVQLWIVTRSGLLAGPTSTLHWSFQGPHCGLAPSTWPQRHRGWVHRLAASGRHRLPALGHFLRRSMAI